MPIPRDDSEARTYTFVYHDDDVPSDLQASYRFATYLYFMETYGGDVGHLAFLLGMLMDWDDMFCRFLTYLFQHIVFQVMDRRTVSRLLNVIMHLVDVFGTDVESYRSPFHYARGLEFLKLDVFVRMAEIDMPIAFVVFDSLQWLGDENVVIPSWSDVKQRLRK